MAKRSNQGSEEPNLDSLLDVATNVVGILMMIFIILGVNMATTIGQILSKLPRVTQEELDLIHQQLAEVPKPVETPEEIAEKQDKAQQELKRVVEQISTIDITDMQQMMLMDLDSFRKKLEETKKQREAEKQETDKLLTEVERLKAVLDETPEYKPEPPTIVRLPNPRPYPAEPSETRIMVAKEGVMVFNPSEFMDPLIDELKKNAAQLLYRDIKIEPFAKMLAEVLGSPQIAQQAWNDIAPLAASAQMEDVALAWKHLKAASLPNSKDTLFALLDIGLSIRASVAQVAEAVAAMAGGDVFKWVALDPSRDPANPTIKASAQGGTLSLTYGTKTDQIKATPSDVVNYFLKDFAARDNIKNRNRAVTIYDAFKIQEALKRAAASQALSRAFNFEPEIRPGQTLVFLNLTPASGGGESLEQIRKPESRYQRLMRQIAQDPNGVALFQVMPDAFATYLEARLIAEENRAPATWETLRSLEMSLPVRGFDVQRFARVPPRRATPPRDTDIIIRGPKRSLD